MWGRIWGGAGLFAVCTVVGCTNDEPGEAATETLDVAVRVTEVGPGVENTVCVTLRLDNEEEVLVSAIRTHLGRGSHHLIVYRSSETVESPTPAPCDPFNDIIDGTAPLFIAQQAEAEVVYPQGTALRLAPGQMIRLEMHYINYYESQLDDVVGQVDFDVAPDDGTEYQEVDLIFFGTRSIDVPPRSEGSAARYYIVPPTTIEHPDPIRIFALTSHMHSHGTRATIHRGTGLADTTDLFHQNDDWAEPPLTLFEEPLGFEGDGMVIRCEYYNDTDEPLTFGELGFNDEMCFGWAYYYPSRGFLISI